MAIEIGAEGNGIRVMQDSINRDKGRLVVNLHAERMDNGVRTCHMTFVLTEEILNGDVPGASDTEKSAALNAAMSKWLCEHTPGEGDILGLRIEREGHGGPIRSLAFEKSN